MTNTTAPEAPSQPVPSELVGTEVVVVVIEHDHGTDSMVFTTLEAAHAHVDNYVAEWWPHELDEQPMPADTAEAREAYFSQTNEWYTISTTTIQD